MILIKWVLIVLYSNNKLVKQLKFNQQKCLALANAGHDLWCPLLAKPRFNYQSLISSLLALSVRLSYDWGILVTEYDYKVHTGESRDSIVKLWFQTVCMLSAVQTRDHLTFLSISLQWFTLYPVFLSYVFKLSFRSIPGGIYQYIFFILLKLPKACCTSVSCCYWLKCYQ